ncbi:MAG: hypothetical protein IPK39_24300 [Sulfuritalea sp.]|nr:hypothetical protein [Sulfuritalea sp.]
MAGQPHYGPRETFGINVFKVRGVDAHTADHGRARRMPATVEGMVKPA